MSTDLRADARVAELTRRHSQREIPFTEVLGSQFSVKACSLDDEET
jgi:hypothetical protein